MEATGAGEIFGCCEVFNGVISIGGRCVALVGHVEARKRDARSYLNLLF